MSTVLIEEFAPLRGRVAGAVVVPGDDSWDEARQAWNLAADQRPAAVVIAESPDDIVEVVRFARTQGYAVSAQGTGHAAAALESHLDSTILVKTHLMRGVEIDAKARIARVEAGALWMDVTVPAQEHGLAALAGSSPDVGIVGYTLGGGLSWLSRTHGVAANSVTAIEVVTADGELVRTDASNEPGLFWALRGGGGSFGIVTAIEFALYPQPQVYAGTMFFPIERAREVLHAWREIAPEMPEAMTTVGRLLMLPPLEEIPEPVRGRSFVIVEAIYLGDEAEGSRLLEPLRRLGPEMDTTGTIPVAALSALHMDPEHPVPGAGDGMLLTDVPAEAIDAVAAAASSVSSSQPSPAPGTGPGGSWCSSVRARAGTVANVSISGWRSSSGRRSLRPDAASPRIVASTTTTCRPRSTSGISGIGGSCSRRPMEVTSSGTVRVHSAHAPSTSAARSIGQISQPANASVTG